MAEDRREQFTEQYVRHERRLFGYVMTLLPDFLEAEEAYQETCLRLWSKWDDFDPNRDFLAWACGYARNVVRELRQKKYRGAAVLDEQTMESIAAVRFRSTLAAEAWQSQLSDCLQELSPPQRELIARYYSGEVPIDVIAAELHATPAALYMRLSRIRGQLFECLQRAVNREGKP
jgi:RNA polymerase sigma-70 factor, ECF subfamily